MIEFNVIDKADILNEETNLKVIDIIEKIINEIRLELNINTDHYVSFIIINNNEIHEINKLYRNVDRATDVITFANIDSYDDETIPKELGDIFISYEKVIEQANEYRHSTLREFSFLVTHGMLHILGYDHMNKEDEEIMFSLQDKILNNLNIIR